MKFRNVNSSLRVGSLKKCTHYSILKYGINFGVTQIFVIPYFFCSQTNIRLWFAEFLVEWLQEKQNFLTVKSINHFGNPLKRNKGGTRRRATVCRRNRSPSLVDRLFYSSLLSQYSFHFHDGRFSLFFICVGNHYQIVIKVKWAIL